MSNNTSQHISPLAEYSIFKPAGTRFPASITNVQDALELLGPTDIASTTVAGVIRIGTQVEVDAGVLTNVVVTPATLKSTILKPDATETTKGVAAIATSAEALAGAVNNKFIVPTTLKAVVDNAFNVRKSTESVQGVIKLSTTAAAQAGTDDTTAMTPLKVRAAITAAVDAIPAYGSATETAKGMVQLATAGQVQAGTLRDGYAVSPYALQQMTGNLTRKGIVQAATQAQVNTGTDDSLYVSAKGFKTYIATATNTGTVKLVTDPGSATPGLALASNAQVVYLKGGQTITGTLNVAGALTQAGSPVVVESTLNSHMPVGSILMWAGDIMPAGGKWEICDGGAKSKTSNPVLFSVLQYKYGGSGDAFNKPDLQGLFVRGANVGKHILAERGLDSKGKDKLGVGVSGGAVGEVQKQGLRKHKHAIADGDYNRAWFDFGASISRGYGGGRNTLWDSVREFTNDGTEIDPAATRDPIGTLNTEEFIGDEVRPWNMSLYYIIKVA